MGTNGLYTFVYKKMYYIFFNGMDSYPSGLGQLLVNEINGWTPEYIEKLKQWVLEIEKQSDCYCGFESLEDSVKNYAKYSHRVTQIPPIFYECQWVYTIDLDTSQFIVQNEKEKQVFDLTNIPNSWNEKYFN